MNGQLSVRVNVASIVFGALSLLAPSAQHDALPSARLLSAPRLEMPAAVDSNVPMTWDLVDGSWRLFAMASWGGIPALMSGQSLDRMQRDLDSVEITPHPGDGLWIQSVLADESGAWYGYYHHEIAARICGRPDRSIPRISAAKSTDRGRSWIDLGLILEAPANAHSCTSSNRFILGGVGDLSAMLDADQRDVRIFFSQYSRERTVQGLALARLAWADRDEPAGRVSVWRSGAWIPATRIDQEADEGSPRWEFPAGTPLWSVSKPWHDGDAAADAFWGPSIHWNTYLERYVMLLNRTKNENFDNEGIYISYARTLGDPDAWSQPTKLMNGGGWYPQVAGLESGSGTDRQAGQRGRFFLTGKSEHTIEFRK